MSELGSNAIQAPLSLLTDRYELSMLDGALTSGVIDARATFEAFTRSLVNGYRYGVVGGTGRPLEAPAAFTFDEDTESWLIGHGIVNSDSAPTSGATGFAARCTGPSRAMYARRSRSTPSLFLRQGFNQPGQLFASVAAEPREGNEFSCARDDGTAVA